MAPLHRLKLSLSSCFAWKVFFRNSHQFDIYSFRHLGVNIGYAFVIRCLWLVNIHVLVLYPYFNSNTGHTYTKVSHNTRLNKSKWFLSSLTEYQLDIPTLWKYQEKLMPALSTTTKALFIYRHKQCCILIFSILFFKYRRILNNLDISSQ